MGKASQGQYFLQCPQKTNTILPYPELGLQTAIATPCLSPPSVSNSLLPDEISIGYDEHVCCLRQDRSLLWLRNMSRTFKKERKEEKKKRGKKKKLKEQKCKVIFSFDTQGHSIQKQGTSECQFLLWLQDIIVV